MGLRATVYLVDLAGFRGGDITDILAEPLVVEGRLFQCQRNQVLNQYLGAGRNTPP